MQYVLHPPLAMGGYTAAVTTYTHPYPGGWGSNILPSKFNISFMKYMNEQFCLLKPETILLFFILSNEASWDVKSKIKAVWDIKFLLVVWFFNGEVYFKERIKFQRFTQKLLKLKPVSKLYATTLWTDICVFFTCFCFVFFYKLYKWILTRQAMILFGPMIFL